MEQMAPGGRLLMKLVFEYFEKTYQQRSKFIKT
jgi:hypothetical protein